MNMFNRLLFKQMKHNRMVTIDYGLKIGGGGVLICILKYECLQLSPETECLQLSPEASTSQLVLELPLNHQLY